MVAYSVALVKNHKGNKLTQHTQDFMEQLAMKIEDVTMIVELTTMAVEDIVVVVAIVEEEVVIDTKLINKN